LEPFYTPKLIIKSALLAKQLTKPPSGAKNLKGENCMFLQNIKVSFVMDLWFLVWRQTPLVCLQLSPV
jgi:hypothetical protein